MIKRFSEKSEKMEPNTLIESQLRSNIYLRRSPQNLIHHDNLNNTAQFFN